MSLQDKIISESQQRSQQDLQHGYLSQLIGNRSSGVGRMDTKFQIALGAIALAGIAYIATRAF